MWGYSKASVCKPGRCLSPGTKLAFTLIHTYKCKQVGGYGEREKQIHSYTSYWSVSLEVLSKTSNLPGNARFTGTLADRQSVSARLSKQSMLVATIMLYNQWTLLTPCAWTDTPTAGHTTPQTAWLDLPSAFHRGHSDLVVEHQFPVLVMFLIIILWTSDREAETALRVWCFDIWCTSQG